MPKFEKVEVTPNVRDWDLTAPHFTAEEIGDLTEGFYDTELAPGEGLRRTSPRDYKDMCEALKRLFPNATFDDFVARE